MAGIDPLDLIAIRSEARTEADELFRAAIIAAHLDGSSNRQIAEVAGMTHEGVRGILKKAGLV